MKNVVKMSCVILLTLFAALTLARPISPPGRYFCESVDPFHQKIYKGILIMRKTGEETYSFTWDFGDKNQFDGTGLFNFRNNSISAVFIDRKKPHEMIGVQTYRLNPNGKILKGPWTLIGAQKNGYQTCEKKRCNYSPHC
jgi:hypothetical protein